MKSAANTPPEKTILLVEDDPVSHTLLSHSITKSYNLISATTLREAIDLLLKGQIDGVVSDFVLPDGNALQILDHMLRYQVNVPAIIISKFSDTKQIAECWAKGAFDFLEKPVNSDELLDVLDGAFHFGQQHARQSTQFTRRVCECDGKELAVLRLDVLQSQFEGEEEIVNTILDAALGELNKYRKIFLDLTSDKLKSISPKELAFHAHRVEGLAKSIYAEELATRCINIQKSLEASEKLQLSDIEYTLGAAQRLATRIRLVQIHALYTSLMKSG